MIAVGSEDDFGFDLSESIEHACDTEIGRARTPNGAEACRCQHGDDRFGNIRQEPRDAIARLNTHFFETRGDARHFCTKLSIRQHATLTALVVGNQRRMVVTIVQQIFGVVESSAGEPARSRHLITIFQNCCCRPLGLHVRKVSYLEPKRIRSLE